MLTFQKVSHMIALGSRLGQAGNIQSTAASTIGAL
jgi:hypothetical protein